MPLVTFNQEVKHGKEVYQEGETRNVTEEEKDYFGAQGWLDGVPAQKDAEQLEVDHGRSLDIVPENPYINDTALEVQNGVIGVEDKRGQ